MSNLNQCNFIGRLGNEPETRFTQSGKAVTNISIAISEKYKDKNTGQQVEKTEWVKIAAFDKLAEIMQEYLKKGNLVYINGKMRTNKYLDKDGKTCYSTEIIANQMQMLEGKGESSKPKVSVNYSSGVTVGDNVIQVNNNLDDFDDDTPF
jgi:single-strand DNA-binding protein